MDFNPSVKIQVGLRQNFTTFDCKPRLLFIFFLKIQNINSIRTSRQNLYAHCFYGARAIDICKFSADYTLIVDIFFG